MEFVLLLMTAQSKNQGQNLKVFLALFKDHGQNPKLEIDFMKDKKRDKFTIIHSAKEVKYDIKSFIVKNVDAISPSLEDIVAQKAEEQISMIYLNNVPDIQEEESEESPRSK